MSCSICYEVPRPFMTFGGRYFHHVWGEYLCPGCWWWACTALGMNVMKSAEEGRV